MAFVCWEIIPGKMVMLMLKTVNSNTVLLLKYTGYALHQIYKQLLDTIFLFSHILLGDADLILKSHWRAMEIT